MDIVHDGDGFEVDVTGHAWLGVAVVTLAAFVVTLGFVTVVASFVIDGAFPGWVICVTVVGSAVVGLAAGLSLWSRSVLRMSGDQLVLERTGLFGQNSRRTWALGHLEEAEVVEVTIGEGDAAATQWQIRLSYGPKALVRSVSFTLPLLPSTLREIAGAIGSRKTR